ncbi:MAG: hypothetical protein WKF84_07725 [Pyrinomonadaceae bacterium]
MLFAAPRVIALQGAALPVRKDREGALYTREHPFERISYKAYSETIDPDPQALRTDRGVYSKDEQARYLQLPENLDERFGSLRQRNHFIGRCSK